MTKYDQSKLIFVRTVLIKEMTQAFVKVIVHKVQLENLKNLNYVFNSVQIELPACKHFLTRKIIFHSDTLNFDIAAFNQF